MRLSSTVEEKAERERRERRMQYASSLPALKVPQHLTKRAGAGGGGGDRFPLHLAKPVFRGVCTWPEWDSCILN